MGVVIKNILFISVSIVLIALFYSISAFIWAVDVTTNTK